MAVPFRPQLRPLEVTPVGPKETPLAAVRDPEGLGQALVMPYGAVLLATLMDGRRTLSEIQSEFRSQVGAAVALSDLEELIRRLDEAYLLAGERFDRYRGEIVASYLTNPVRPAAHAGGAYADQPDALRKQLAELFTTDGGPGAVDQAAASRQRRLCGVIAPHIDLHRGGSAFAWAYKVVAEHSDADLFVIFGTAHGFMNQPFCASRKDFDTPLGIVQTDRPFVDRLAGHLGSSVAGQQIDLFEDEPAHRFEHSIEFQVMFLQYMLGGKREFRIVPILTASFQEFLDEGFSPVQSPQVQAFVSAVRRAADQHRGKVCYISGADFAHIGTRFGDDRPVDQRRLAEQSEDDRKLLELACGGDSAGFFRHVAERNDRSRICGLAPTYTMLDVMGPSRGELLKYDQATEPDGSSCVSFASVAFYRK